MLFRRALLFLWIALLPLHLFSKPPELTARDTRIKIEEILRAHATHHTLNQELIKRSFENFLHEIDPNYTYLIEPEVVTWTAPTEELLTQTLEEYQRENFSTFEQIHHLMVKAIERRRSMEERIDLMAPPSHVERDEFKDMSWAKTEEELESRLLRIRGLQLETAQQILDNESKETFVQRLDKQRRAKEDDFLVENGSHQKQHVLSNVLKAISAALDSQTNYFTPSEAAQFMIQVQQRLFGVGAQLRDDLNGFTIVRILENSPMSRHTDVQIGDQIVAIDHKPVIGLELPEAVELIRGPQNTPVTLTLLRNSEEKFDVVITRDEIVLKESRLESSYEPFGDGVIATVKLFSFYQDPKFSSTADLQEALEKIKKEHNLKGVILDLRSNAGGLLPQAVGVAGLFIKKGVVVSVKDNTGHIQKLRNIESQTTWDGPLLILTNKASASAAEIVAQTLQEYGRAFVVGDASTYGKGTFQTFTLEATNYGKVNPKGEFKVTRGQYYTVSGKTPQLVGVIADIEVRSIFSEMEIGEKFSKYPLEPDEISPSFEDDLSDIPAIHRPQVTRMYKFDLQPILTTYAPYLPTLKKNSVERLKLNKNYQNFLEAISNKDFNSLPSFGQADLQLHEAINIMKDLLMLMQADAA